jgi:hypothetical protein
MAPLELKSRNGLSRDLNAFVIEVMNRSFKRLQLLSPPFLLVIARIGDKPTFGARDFARKSMRGEILSPHFDPSQIFATVTTLKSFQKPAIVHQSLVSHDF